MTLFLVPTRPADYTALNGASAWHGWQMPEGGLEPEHVLTMLAELCANLDAAQGWGTWLGVVGDEVVASAAVKAPVVAGRVEIGYAVAPARRGRGYGTLLVGALLPVLAEKGVTVVCGESAVTNPASGRVLAKAGFREIGRRSDVEDGLLIVWELVLQP